MATLNSIITDWAQEHAEHRDDYGDKPWGWQWGGEDHQRWIANLLKDEFLGLDVFEIGCGGGKYSRLIMDLGAKSLLACDVHMTAIDSAYEYEPRGKYVLSDGESIPADDNSFDLVFTYDVLLHLPPELIVKYLHEGWRVGRRMIFQLPSLDLPGGRAWFGEYIKHRAYLHPYSLGYFNFYSDAQVSIYAQIAGWRLITEIGRNERDKVWVLEK